VPCANQKLLFKGQLKDASTLREAGLKQGSKLMVIGTKPEDTKVATTTKPVAVSADWDAAAKKEPWSEMPQHKKVREYLLHYGTVRGIRPCPTVTISQLGRWLPHFSLRPGMQILDKGRPDDGWAGIKDRQIPLRDDQTYIPGLLNSQGTLVRLTFRQDLQQLWIGSAVSTQKIFYQSVHKIEAQPIVGQEEYSIMRLQVGAAASSNYWLYFVPSQSVASVKVRVRGVASLLE